jgi:alpha-1,2-mannosyltransferase
MVASSQVRAAATDRPAPNVDRRWLIAATIVGAIAFWFIAAYAWYGLNIGFDVKIILNAARAGASGATLYSDPTGAAFGAESPHFYGPPALALVYLPLSLLPDDLAVRVALVTSYAVALASLALLVVPVRAAVGRSGVASLLIGIVLSYAFLGAGSLGNPSILVLLGLAVAFVGLERDRPFLAALGIGTAAALRLYPVLLLLPLVVARRWAVVAATIAVIGAWGLLGIAVFGLDDTMRYVGLAWSVLRTPDPNDIAINAALPAVAARLFDSDSIATVVRVGSVMLGVAGLVFGGMRLRDATAERRLVGLGIAACGMLLVPATIWDHYLTAALVLAVGIVAVTRHARWGLLPAGLLPGVLGGATALVWMPVVALAHTLRRRSGVGA